jgi:uncharacterized membrane protein (Fun14 family)
MATRAVAKILVVLFAVVFVAVQFLAYKGILTVDWPKFGTWVNDLVLNMSGEHGLGAMVRHKIPAAGSLGVGYYLGLKRG